MIPLPANSELLAGLDSSLMQPIDEHHLLHQQVLPAFAALTAAMAEDGIILKVASGVAQFRATSEDLAG
ncbi:hypothetical protein [Alishewanella longhuensis]